MARIDPPAAKENTGRGALSKQHRQHNFALTVLFVAVVFFHILLTVLITGLVLYILIRFSSLEGAEHSQLSEAKVILFFCLASLPVGAAMTFLVGKFLLRPINTVINQINRLADGDFKARIDLGPLLGKFSAFKELNDSFNRMAQELEGTEMLRSDFINNFSHEFKTPIVSIAGFAQLLRCGNVTQAQREEYLGIIESESMRLSQMATNVLNLTKVENQTVLTNVTVYNLSEQIRSSILLLSSKWENREIDFGLDFAEYNISANEELLKQVWINLIDNAIKFSDTPGVIEVDIQQQGEHTIVAVTNAGPTIPPEKQKKIFNKFYQADESHGAAGNGVGLAIVKRVVELHGGSVSVISGTGSTTFTVTLPR